MDRRRFEPSSEGLEGRALLSLFGHTKTPQIVNVEDLPLTYLEKQARIERLPYYLNQLLPGRFIPVAALSNLQTNLQQIAGVVPHSPPPAILNVYNHNLREALPKESLSIHDAEVLDNSFGAVLSHTGMSPDLVAAFKADLNEFAKIDSHSRQPVFLALNDNAVILQDTLAVGRPIARPGIPDLALGDGLRVKMGISVTTVHRPNLVGNYLPGTTALDSPLGTTIQAVDQEGNVVGETLVPRDGKYVLPITVPLPLGTNLLHLRAVDQQGLVSNLSEVFLIRVIPRRHQEVITGVPTPQGPAGTV